MGGALLSGTKCSVEDTFISVPSLVEVREEFRVPPSDDEVLAAISTLKSGKAPEGRMVCCLKCCGANLLDYLVELFNQV